MKNEKVLIAMFTSKARVKILSLLLNEKKKICEADIVFKLGLPRSTVVNELKKLSKNSILEKDQTNKRTYYSTNKDFIYFDELKKIFKQKG